MVDMMLSVHCSKIEGNGPYAVEKSGRRGSGCMRTVGQPYRFASARQDPQLRAL